MELLRQAAETIIGRAPVAAAGPKRPERLTDLAGQDSLVEEAEMILAGAKQFGESLGHVLLAGPPGTGKTTIARVLANEVGGRLIDVGVGGIKRPEDVYKFLSQLRDGDILFIDEIHQVPQKVQEHLFIPMEDNRMVLQTGDGPRDVELPRWTLIGATTLPHKLDPALKRRFPNKFPLKLLKPEDLEPIAKSMAASLGVAVTDEAIGMLARMGGGTPGLTKNMLMKARNAMALLKKQEVDADVVRAMQGKLRLDHLGLDENERGVLETLEKKSPGQPTSLNELSNTLGLDKRFIEDDLEPRLIRHQLMRRGHGGREITDKGREHLRTHRASR